MKAMHLKENNHSTDAPTSNSIKGNKFSIRTPLNLSKIGSTKEGSDLMERGHATATQFQTTKNTTAGFFPAVSGGLQQRTQSIDHNQNANALATVTAGFNVEKTAKFGATNTVFGHTANSMFSELKRKVTHWDKNNR